MQPILVVGSSWNAGVVIDIIHVEGNFQIVGFLDDTEPAGTIKRGYKVLGAVADVVEISEREKCKSLVLTIGDNWWRRKIFNAINDKQPPYRAEDFAGGEGMTPYNRAIERFNFPVIKHPSAVTALGSSIGQGALLMAQSHVGRGSDVGMFCIVNTGSSLDHDCKTANFSSLAPGVSMGGLVEIGECSHIGVGASISDRKKIGAHTVVGSGSVVVRDIPALSVAYGNPARVKRPRAEGDKYL
jgi:acetyltransferase-like isoleucine patch superfamily enzyme